VRRSETNEKKIKLLILRCKKGVRKNGIKWKRVEKIENG